MLKWDEVSPVLHATYALLNERPNGLHDEHIAEALPGMNLERVREALLLLKTNDYIYAYRGSGGRIDSIQPREKGLQVTMGWPAPGSTQGVGVDVLLQVLDERVQTAQTTEERSKTTQVRDAVGDAGTTIVGEVLGSWLARMTGAG